MMAGLQLWPRFFSERYEMKRLFLCLGLFLALSPSLFARAGQWIYTAGYKVASGTSAVVTLENPSDSTREARVLAVEIYLEVGAGDVTISRDATSITGGSGLTEQKSSAYHGNDAIPDAAVVAKSGATVSGETDLPAARPIPSGTVMVISYDDVELVAGESFAVSVAADASDSITVIVVWEEVPAE